MIIVALHKLDFNLMAKFQLTLLLTCMILISSCNRIVNTNEDWCDQELRSQYSELQEIETSSNWFKVYLVAEGVFAIAEPFNFQEVISYLIIGNDKALLFDTGMGISSIRLVVEELTSLPITVLNSHTHYDHIGSNYEFDNILAMNTEYTISRAENGMAHSLVSHEVSSEAICLERAQGFDTTAYHIKPFTITELISDGHIIDLGNRKLEVIASPGHTPDAVALLDKEGGFMWTGDTFYEGPIWLFDPETDLMAYQTSLERLLEKSKGLTKVFTAHNTPVAEPIRITQLKTAFTEIINGEKAPKTAGDTAHVNDDAINFEFEHFAFSIRRDLLGEKGIIKR